jgi:hypothetical protein
MGGGGSGGTHAPEAGFYQVLQEGVQILNSSITNLTNGSLSGMVNNGFEAGNAAQGSLHEAFSLTHTFKVPGSFPRNDRSGAQILTC